MSKRLTWWWLLPLFLLVTWLSARSLSAYTFWFDEYISVYNSGGSYFGPLSPAEIWTRVANDDFQTPGYYFAVAGWGRLVGWSEFAGRSLSLLFGLLAIALTYRLARDMISPRAGIAAAVTMAFSAFFVNYMHEMRAYTLYALFAALTVWAYWRMITPPPYPLPVHGEGEKNTRLGFGIQAAFVLGVAGLFYTHYFASLTAVALGVYHLLFVRKNKRWLRIFILMVIGGALFLPWFGEILLTASYLNQHAGNVRLLAMDNGSVVETTLYMFSNGSIALLAVVGVFSLRRPGRATWMAWFWGLFVLGASLLINAALGVLFSIRHLIGLWPALALIAGIGIDRLAENGLPPAPIYAVWIIACLWNTLDPTTYATLRQPFAHLPWDKLNSALTSHVQADDSVVYLLPDPASVEMHNHVFDYYLHGLPGQFAMLESPARKGPDAFDRQAHLLTDDAQRLWVGYDPAQPPSDRMQMDQVLITNHIVCGTVADAPLLHLNVYAPLPSANALTLHFGAASLSGAAGADISAALLLPLKDSEYHTLNVMLAWTIGASVPANTYSVALHVEDANGQLVGQTDYGLPTEPYSCHSADVGLDNLPPGRYRLMVSVYNWSTGERLTASNVKTGEQGDRLTMGGFGVRN